MCSTISMFQDVRDSNKLKIQNYFEVYLRVPIQVLHKRDPKGFYSHQKDKQENLMVEIDTDFQEPENPDLVIDNYGDLDCRKSAAEIYRAVFNCH